MKVAISDLFVGDCELTQKTGVEVVRIQLEEKQPESVIATAELIRLLRFTKRQCEKSEVKRNPGLSEHPAGTRSQSNSVKGNSE